MSTKIEWVKNPDGTQGVTWNPVVGCTKVSAGCRNCYAERMAGRLAAMGLPQYQDVVRYRSDVSGLLYTTRAAAGDCSVEWSGNVSAVYHSLTAPLHWKTPRMIFVGSMGDLFHEQVPDDFIDQVFAIMALCPQHIFLVLTKRPERLCAYLHDDDRGTLVRRALERFQGLDVATELGDTVFDMDRPLTDCSFCEVRVPTDNIWFGTSVENQETLDERVPWLLKCPATVRFLSAEPLLGPLHLDPWLYAVGASTAGPWRYPSGRIERGRGVGGATICSRPANELHWVIVGGETGPGARPMHPDWVRGIRDQCQAAGVPFFFKSWGTWIPGEYAAASSIVHRWPDGTTSVKVGKKHSGRLLDGRTWDEMPEVTDNGN